MRVFGFVILAAICGSALAGPSETEPRLIQGEVFEGLAGEALRLENETHVTIRGCRFRDVGVAIRLIDCHFVTIEGCDLSDLKILGIELRGGCSDIRIVGNRMTGFRDDVQGGHFISTQKTAQPKQARITIEGNTLIGNGKSFVPGRKDGAAGDMIALRSVSDFRVIGNHLSGGGEFGLDCVHGCEHGIIADNRIRDTDATGLLIGYGVRNVIVRGNVIVDCGRSYETDGSKNDITHQAGIHCRNGVENVVITGNLIVREKAPELRYGIHLRETSGVIQGNHIVGVDEEVHVPQALRDTVDIR